VVRMRHTDAQLLELARDGSAPAFGSLLHRHRRRLQREAVQAQDPTRALTDAGVAAMRALRRGTVGADDPGTWLAGLVAEEAQRDPAPDQVEPMLGGDWFPRLWVELDRRWPSGRRRVSPPRWATMLVVAVVLAIVSGVTTYLVLTDERTTEVVLDLVATPLEGPGALREQGFVPPEPEEAPELFGDVELGELPSYDLTGPGGTAPAVPSPPSIGPPTGGTDADAPADQPGGTGR